MTKLSEVKYTLDEVQHAVQDRTKWMETGVVYVPQGTKRIK